ncbi:conjugative relaxase [Sphingomonas sp. SUN039]|nr:MobF family relaxase [Sphingomonas sp. SUN039]UVO53719.1 conjugative relaxase [Sphingomonas sp. SUN039]
MASVRSATGSANYFAADNYYTLEEAENVGEWFGVGAVLLGLADKANDGVASDEPLALSDADELSPDALGSDGDRLPVDGDPLVEDETAEAGVDAQPDTRDARDARSDLPGQAEDFDGLGLDFEEAVDAVSASEGHDAPPLEHVGVDLDTVSFATVDQSGHIVTDDGTRLSSNPTPNEPPSFNNPGGKVDRDTFKAILNGKLGDGRQVGDTAKRQLGMDLTFSMSKSASIVALIGGDRRVLAAHRDAVKGAIAFAEANFAEARVKQDGKAIPVRTGNLVTAMFEHDTSRALDPQSHIHVVIASLTRTPDGQWRALHNRELWQHKTVISSVYAALFRNKVEELGYRTEAVGKHGAFEITGVPSAVRAEFSQRRQAILAKQDEIGSTSFEARNKITVNTRDAKRGAGDRTQLHADWQHRTDALGFDAKAFVRDATERSRAPATLFERGIIAVRRAVADAKSIITNLERPHDPLVGNAVIGNTMTAATVRTQLAVASAIRILSQREAAFEVHHVTKTALDLGLKGVDHHSVAKRVTELIVQGHVVPGASTRRDGVVTMLTTREALATEIGILREIEAGKSAVAPLLRPDRAVGIIGRAAGDQELNAGQMAAAVSILSSNDRVVAVQGIAGAGKSTMLGAVARVLAFENKPAEGLAFQNKMVADLSDGTGLASRTVASFVMRYEKHLGTPHGKGFDAAKAELRGSYRILDEASMVSNDQMLKLIRIANLMDIEKLVLVGDRQQLLSIDAGKSFALVQAGGVETARMNENLRQRTPELRAIAALTNDGRTGDAIKLLGSNVVESDDRVAEAAERWMNLLRVDREATMLFTSGRETRTNLNRAIQAGLRSEGELKHGGLVLTVLERVNGTSEEMRYSQTYIVGLQLEVRRKIDNVGLDRGTYQVTQVFKNGKVGVLRGGKPRRFDPQKLPVDDKNDRLSLATPKIITIHEGDRIRWTENDKKRGLLNSATAKVLGIDNRGVTFERPDKTVIRLSHGDPMLARLDLAYTLNMHMAQGITTDRAIIVMGSEERYLTNQRLFNVAVTRVRDGVTVVTDDRDKLARQLDRTTGDKYSALETVGALRVDRQQPGAAKFDPGQVVDLARAAQAGRTCAPSSANSTDLGLPSIPVPSKEKTLDL